MDQTALAEDIVKKAVKKGCDKAEVFIKTAKRLSVEAKDSSVEALESARDFGMSLKVIKKQRLGFSFTTTPDGVGDIINEAVKGADWTESDKYVDIPDYIPPSAVSVLDERIENLKEEDIIKNAMLLEKAALDFDTRIKKVRKAEIALAVANTTIFNSRGVNVSYESGYLTALVTTFASDGQDSQTGWDFATSRRLSDIDFISIARSASKKAIDLLGAKKISAVKVPVILDSSVASDFLDIFSASLSAEAVQKKRSFLAGKVGKNVISPVVNIVDDGLMPWGVGTKPVDDEGVPTLKKIIVSSGILTGFIHNTYTAKKEGVTSTGNATRGSFKSLPGIDVTNLYIEPIENQKSVEATSGLSRTDLRGRSDSSRRLASRDPLREVSQSDLGIESYRPSRSEQLFAKTRFERPASGSQRSEANSKKSNRLIKSVSKGFLILDAMGVHTADPISGDFSVGISGFWIEGGKIAYPVKEAIMSGNILELFKRVGGIGDDLRFYGKIGSPSLLIGEMDISA